MFIYFRLIVYFCVTFTLTFCSINFCDWTCFQYRVYFVFNYWFHGRKSILSRGEIQHKQRWMIQWQTHAEGTMWIDFVEQTDLYFHLLFIDLKIYNIYKNVWTSVLEFECMLRPISVAYPMWCVWLSLDWDMYTYIRLNI